MSEWGLITGRHRARHPARGTDPAVFTRVTTAYDQAGNEVAIDTPRYEDAAAGFGKAVTLEGAATNLCTENQSDVETDTTGFAVVGTASISRSTAEHFTGTASLKVDTADEAISGVSLTPSPITNDGITKTFQVRIKGTAGVVVACQLSSTVGYVTLTGGWDRKTVTAPPHASTAVAFFTGYGSSPQVATTFYVDAIQVEKSPYCTTWHIGGGTRNAEVLTMLKAGTLQDAQGSIEGRVKPLRTYGTNAQYVFDGNGAANKSLVVYIASATGKWTLVYGTGAAEVTITSSGAAAASGTIYGVECHWSVESGMELLVNGVSVGSNATAPGFVLGATMYQGSKADGSLQFDGLIDDFCGSFLRRSTVELKARYDAGTPLVVDGDTGVIYPFDSDLAVKPV